MGNYKGLKFTNNMDSFKNWCNAFPLLDAYAVKATGYKNEGNYYMELQLVEGFLNGPKFIATSIREYNHETKDFENISMEKEKELLETVFKNKYESFKEKYL